MSDGDGIVRRQIYRDLVLNGPQPIGAEGKHCCRCGKYCPIGSNRGWLEVKDGEFACPDCQTPKEKEEYARTHK